MAVVGNLPFFLRLTWEFLGHESERGGSVCWPNNKITLCFSSLPLYLVLIARSIYQNFYFLDLKIYLMVMVCYIYLCVRVARSIQYTKIFYVFDLKYLFNGNGVLYLFMCKSSS